MQKRTFDLVENLDEDLWLFAVTLCEQINRIFFVEVEAKEDLDSDDTLDKVCYIFILILSEVQCDTVIIDIQVK